jgi:hypothetical protein
MESITIHNLPAPLATQIKEKAKKENLSLNKTIQMLLEKALGLASHRKRNLSRYTGAWTQKEYEEFEHAMKDQEQIDKELWQ